MVTTHTGGIVTQSLIEAVLTQRSQERQRMVEEAKGREEAAACAVCGRAVRSDNLRRLCKRCQEAHLSPRLCACGCGEHIDPRTAVEGYRVRCFRRLCIALSSTARQRGVTLVGLLAELERRAER